MEIVTRFAARPQLDLSEIPDRNPEVIERQAAAIVQTVRMLMRCTTDRAEILAPRVEQGIPPRHAQPSRGDGAGPARPAVGGAG